jgi:uncharacterized protein YkwD
MNRLVVLFVFFTNFSFVNAQTWTSAQLDKANTAKNSTYLTTEEKETILYINLCRLYPKDFLRNELMNYYGTEKYGDYVRNSSYRESLIKLLNTMQPVNALYFDLETYTGAKCFAKEQGQAGTTGHSRKSCKADYDAECCSYGMETGRDIAMQLLIDDDVPSLGHRIICLDNEYTKIGVSVQPHKNWDVVAVLNFNR